MASVQRKLVHKQFNSPIGLYSDNNVKSTLNRELKAFSNGTMGVDCDDNAKPANLANSAVLKLLEEEERQKQAGGPKRVTWPPEHEYQARAASVTRQSPALQPQHRQSSPYPQYQNGAAYNPSGHNPSTQYRQPSPAVNYQNPQAVNYPNQPYQVQQPQSSPNYPQSGYQQPGYKQPGYQQGYQHQGHQQPTYQQPGHQQQAHHQAGYQQQGQQQPAYQQQAYQQPAHQQSGGYQQQQYQQPGYQRQVSEKSQYPSAQDFSNPDPTYLKQATPSYMPTQQSTKPPSCTTAFSGGVSVGNKGQARAENLPNWAHVQPSKPVRSGYVQPQYTQQPSQPSQAFYQSEPSYAVNQNQYQPQQTYQQPAASPVPASVQQHQYQPQPQPQKQYHPEENFYRQPSPGVITLRKELPVSQRPPLVYASEPAAYSFGGGGNMRGDNKWPPEEYKRQSEIDNEQRRQLALGPACRPRRVNKDYSSFFQRHALNSTYPGYRAPPGTQHVGYQYPQYPHFNQ